MFFPSKRNSFDLYIIMNQTATNKIKTIPTLFNKISHPELHVKILDLVAHRINPVKQTLCFEKNGCNSCVARSKSPSINSTKINSVMASKTKEKGWMGEASHCHKDKPKKQDSQKQLSVLHTKELILEKRRILGIQSKTVSISIDSTNIANMTIDLRSQLASEFVSSKLMHKLKLQSIQKQQRIKFLQKQLQQSKTEIEQLHEDMNKLKNIWHQKAYSQQHFPEIQSNDNIKYHSSNSLREQSVQNLMYSECQHPNSCFPMIAQHQNNDYESLIHIIKTQALYIENIKKKETNWQRPRAWSKPI